MNLSSELFEPGVSVRAEGWDIAKDQKLHQPLCELVSYGVPEVSTPWPEAAGTVRRYDTALGLSEITGFFWNLNISRAKPISPKSSMEKRKIR